MSDPAARGFFLVGVWHPKHEVNVGTLWRAAYVLGAAGIFTVGRRYTRQASDTCNAAGQVPLVHYEDIESLHRHLPYACPLVGVEMCAGARKLSTFTHPFRAAYLLGAEDHGLPQRVLDRCHIKLRVDTVRETSLNVATAGALVLWHRHLQQLERRAA